MWSPINEQTKLRITVFPKKKNCNYKTYNRNNTDRIEENLSKLIKDLVT